MVVEQSAFGARLRRAEKIKHFVMPMCVSDHRSDISKVKKQSRCEILLCFFTPPSFYLYLILLYTCISFRFILRGIRFFAYLTICFL